MGFILHRGGNQRYVLQSEETGVLVGLLFPPVPGESRQSFSYNFGSTNDRKEITNIDEFPELINLQFFIIESTGAVEFDRAFQSAEWESLRALFGATAKTVGYNCRSSEKPFPSAPIVWQYTPPNLKGLWKIPAWALWVNQEGVWMGNRDGLILVLNHEGEVLNQHQLDKMTRSLGESSQGFYAVCDDGKVYDLSSKLPQPIYNARNSKVAIYYDFQVQVLTVKEPEFFVADVYGNLTCLDENWQIKWQRETGYWQSWLLQVDDQAVYLGHWQGVTCLERNTGRLIWHQPTPAPVLSGVLLDDRLLVGASDGTLYSLLKAGDLKAQTTEIQAIAQGLSAVYACTWSEVGNCLIAADGQAKLYGFSVTGDRLWQYLVNCGSILNLQSWGDRLYGVTTDGTLVGFDVNALLNST